MDALDREAEEGRPTPSAGWEDDLSTPGSLMYEHRSPELPAKCSSQESWN